MIPAKPLSVTHQFIRSDVFFVDGTATRQGKKWFLVTGPAKENSYYGVLFKDCDLNSCPEFFRLPRLGDIAIAVNCVLARSYQVIPA